MIEEVELDDYLDSQTEYLDPFIGTIAFFGGPYMVFRGSYAEDLYTVRLLLTAIYNGEENFEPGTLHSIQTVTRASLALSDRIIERAALSRKEGLEEETSLQFDLSDLSRIERFARATKFSEEEITDLLYSYGASAKDLEGLIVDSTDLPTNEEALSSLMLPPILKSGSIYLAINPLGILTFLRNKIISICIDSGEKAKVAKSFHAVAHTYAYRALIENSQKPINMSSHIDDQLSIQMFATDSDKLTALVTISDDLRDYDVGEPHGFWETANVTGLLSKGFSEISKWWATNSFEEITLTVIVAYQGVGRSFALDVDEVSSGFESVVCLSIEELETSCIHAKRNMLWLWQLLEAEKAVLDNFNFIYLKLTDLENLYIRHGHRLLLPARFRRGERVQVFVPTGLSGEMARENQLEKDRHAVQDPSHRGVAEVRAFHDARYVPIYIRDQRPSERIELFVEGAQCFWILAGDLGENTRESRMLTYLIQDALSHWLWRLAPEMELWLDGNRYPIVSLKVSWIDSEPIDTEACVWVTRSGTYNLDVFVSEALKANLDQPDNSGERQIIRALLPELYKLFTSSEIGKGRVADILEQYMPLGMQKKILYSKAPNPYLTEGRLPSYRRVQQYNIAMEEVAMSKSLLQSISSSNPRSDIGTHLNAAVGDAFGRLTSLIMKYDSRALLEQLIADYEQVIYSTAEAKLTLPSILACYAEFPEFRAGRLKDLDDFALQAIATRFLIELTASSQGQTADQTRPPKSFKDEIQAIAQLIYNLGSTSDAFRHGLSDVSIIEDDYGLLRPSAEAFVNARQVFAQQYHKELLGTLESSFTNLWNKRPNINPDDGPIRAPDLILEADIACKAEFGHSLQLMLAFLHSASNLGFQSQEPIAMSEKALFLATISEHIEVEESTCQSLLKLFSIVPRQNFLKPEGYESADVYPWIFNRRQSYLRRPFIIAPTSQAEHVLWGPRHCAEAAENLFGIITSGRIRDRTSVELRSFCSKVNDIQGKDFERVLRSKFSGQDRFEVSPGRVRRFGKLQLPNNDDIDVLLVDKVSRAIYLIECKRFAMARTSAELGSQIKSFFEDGDKSIIKKQQARAKFVEAHLELVKITLNLESQQIWKVVPLIVTDIALFTPHLRKAEIPILSQEQLMERITIG